MVAKDNSQRAIIVVIVTVFALALGDALIKGASAAFSLWQVFVLRALIVLPVLAALYRWRQPGESFVPKACFWTILRSMCLTVMWGTYYWSLAHVELSTAAATYYTLPIFITLFAAAFLGDSIGRFGWIAIALGFIGVVLIIEPRAEDFNWYAILPLISAILYAVAMILTRSRCRGEHILILSLWLNMIMLITGAVTSLALIALPFSSEVVADQSFLLGSWTSLNFTEWMVLGVLSVAIIIGSIGAAYAYQNGRPATIATFDFAYVAFAMFWGVIIFDETLTTRIVVGVLLIVVAGILAVNAGKKSASIS